MALREFGEDNTRPIILENDPAGNSGGLGGFHTVNPEDREPSNTPKIVGGLVVALMLGAAGAYIYSVSGQQQPKQVVAANELPAPPAPTPAPQPAPMPASDNTAAPAPAAPIPAADTSKPETKPVIHTASVSKARSAAKESADLGAANARMQAADSTPAVQPQQQSVTAPTQTAAVPEPVSPQAPVSSQASVAQPTNPEVAPQQSQSSTPTADNAAPAQDQQTGATPAPAPAQAQPAQTTQQ